LIQEKDEKEEVEKEEEEEKRRKREEEESMIFLLLNKKKQKKKIWKQNEAWNNISNQSVGRSICSFQFMNWIGLDEDKLKIEGMEI
jgi:hypothetical protein